MTKLRTSLQKLWASLIRYILFPVDLIAASGMYILAGFGVLLFCAICLIPAASLILFTIWAIKHFLLVP